MANDWNYLFIQLNTIQNDLFNKLITNPRRYMVLEDLFDVWIKNGIIYLNNKYF